MEKNVDIPINNSEPKPDVKPVKKGPGRPRKQKAVTQIPRHGVTDTPHHQDDKMELVYDNPEMWKKIFTVFKHMKVSAIIMHFDKENLVITSRDAETEKDCKNHIYVIIYGSKQNRYYCESPFSIQMGYEDIEKYLRELSKEHTLISFVSRKLDWQSKLRMLFKYEGSVTNTDQQDLEVQEVLDATEKPSFKRLIEKLSNEDSYNISMLLPAKYFKQKITHASSMTEQIKILKDGSGPLQIKYNAKTLKSAKTINFPNATQISLESDIEDGDVFSASVYVNNIKPFASGVVTDYIRLSVDRHEPMIFTALLDADVLDDKKRIPKEGTETAVLKVVTKIINYKTLGDK